MLRFASAVVLAAAGLLSSLSAPPPRGPGAVLAAATDILTAIERGDAAALRRAFAPMAPEQGVHLAGDAGGELQPVEHPCELVFADLGADGVPVTATTVDAAVRRLLDDVRGKGVTIEHRILSVRADCPSGDCSWGSIDFERVLRRGETTTVVPMRVTLVTRYGAEVPHMRPFVWQAARMR